MEKVKLLIGRREKVDFPKLKLFGINAKVDTGAYTSAIHCDSIRAVRKGGERFVRFRLLDPSHSAYNGKEIRKPLLGRRKIKNSFGQSEFRYIIKTRIGIFGREYEIELSLSDRSGMEHPILLGRKFIQDKFVVDVSRFDLSQKKKVIVINENGKPERGKSPLQIKAKKQDV
ncbi:MAG: ATP-dependent zinc protease [Thermodesulfobacteriota bacterium]